MKKKAFTLIELLVVIAFIGILVSILLPALRKAKYQARLLLDKTNLKTLASAMGLYLTQSDGKFFPYGDNGNLWLNRIGHNIDDVDDVRFCPETKAKISETESLYNSNPGNTWGESMRPWLWDNSTTNASGYEMGSYGFNGWFYADNNNFVPSSMSNYPFNSVADVRVTSKTPFFLDANWVDAWPSNTNVLPTNATQSDGTSYYDKGDRTNGTTSTSIGRFVLNRHGRNTNGAFVDMHVETITHEQLWTLAWHKGSQPNFSPILPGPRPRDK